jgi:hypothetical protein
MSFYEVNFTVVMLFEALLDVIGLTNIVLVKLRGIKNVNLKFHY